MNLNEFICLLKINWVYILKKIIKLILATDMVKHKQIIEDFQQNLENFDPLDEEHMNNVSSFYKINPFWYIFINSVNSISFQ